MNPDDGLPSVVRSHDLLARQKLRDLKTRWGAEKIEAIPGSPKLAVWTKAPEMITVLAMGYREYWKKWEHPIMPPKTIDLTEYQLVEKRVVTDGAT